MLSVIQAYVKLKTKYFSFQILFWTFLTDQSLHTFLYLTTCKLDDGFAVAGDLRSIPDKGQAQRLPF